MNALLWLLQVFLMVAFMLAGAWKLFVPVEVMANTMAWVDSVPEWLVRFVGACEILGGLGLVLPAALRIKPILTPIAAMALGAVVISAAGLHISRGEWPNVGVTIFALAMLSGVVWGRLKVAPIKERKHTRSRRELAGIKPMRAS